MITGNRLSKTLKFGILLQGGNFPENPENSESQFLGEEDTGPVNFPVDLIGNLQLLKYID